MSERVTINEIARLCGVSKATVSYVMNDRRSGFKISAATSSRVLELCRSMDYRPEEAAVKLAECRKRPVDLLVMTPWLYESRSDFTAQLNDVLRRWEEKSRLRVSYLSYTSGNLSQRLKASVIKRHDVVLIVGTSREDDSWLGRHAENLPNLVLMNRHIEGCLSVYGNDCETVKALTEKIDLKHYRQAVYFISNRRSYSEEQRCSGFRSGMAAAGVSVHECCGYVYDQLWQQVAPMLEESSGSLLVFVPVYSAAALLLKNALEAGGKIPEELGIVTYDCHSFLSKFVTPSLTTVEPHLSTMAEEVLMLAAGLRDGIPQCSKVIDADFVLGGSTINQKTEQEAIRK